MKMYAKTLCLLTLIRIKYDKLYQLIHVAIQILLWYFVCPLFLDCLHFFGNIFHIVFRFCPHYSIQFVNRFLSYMDSLKNRRPFAKL